MATFHEKVENLKSAISRAEMFVNTGGDPQGIEAGPVRNDLLKAWDDFAEEFVAASAKLDS